MTIRLLPPFVPLAAVSWNCPELFSVFLSHRQLEARFGPPSLPDMDSNGIGPIDVWLLGFPCGLEMCIWRGKIGETGALIDENTAQWTEVLGNQRERGHLVSHLGFDPVPRVSLWKHPTCEIGPLDWRLLRQDDNGHRFEAGRYSSACEARFAQEEFERHIHKQFYWVEGPTEG